LQDLKSGDPERALHEACCCHRLRPGDESHRLMALCQLLTENWHEALVEAGNVALEATEPE